MTKKGYAAAGIAVVGFVAVSAFYLLGSASSSSTNFLSLSQSAGVDLAFVNFIGKYQKQYASKEEFEYRMQVFQNNLAQAENHNAQNSGSSYRLGVNKFSDLTFEEYQERLGLKGNAQGHRKIDRSGENSFIVFNTTNLPSSVDWRPTGAVTKVKDQGSCGSCYAFSAVGAIEGQYWNLTRKTTDLSVQQIIDCADGEYQNQGCGGGLPDWVFDYVWDNGIETAADYPLQVSGGGFCNDEPSEYVAQLTHYWDVTHLNPDQLKGAVAQVGPISIGVGAGNAAWFQYAGGIIDNADVCKPNLDHAVLLVGYGTEGGRDFWIVKNTWGEDWGEQGYVRILVSSGFGVCGVNMTPIFPSIKLI